MKPDLVSNKKVLKITTNTVHTVISNMIADRDRIKKILVVTLADDGVYRLNTSKMKNEEKIAMCEVAKRKSLNFMLGKDAND